MTRLALVLALMLGLGACSTGKDAVVSGGEFEFVAPGGKTELFYEGAERRPLGSLSGESLLEPGKQIRLSDFAGKVVVINVWGSWCGPCRTEAPDLQRIYDVRRDAGVQVLGIDVRDDVRSVAEDFLRDRGLNYPSVYDPPGRSLLSLKGYPRNVVPSTIVLDRQHRVAAVYLKTLLADELLPTVDRLAAEK